MIRWLGVIAIALLFAAPGAVLAQSEQATPLDCSRSDTIKSLQDRIKCASQSTATGAGFQEINDPELYLQFRISDYVQVFLGFLGVIFLILAIYAGYLWLTAGGNAEQVTKAKDYIRNAIIGLVIVATAFIITRFIVESVL